MMKLAIAVWGLRQVHVKTIAGGSTMTVRRVTAMHSSMVDAKAMQTNVAPLPHHSCTVVSLL